MLRKKERKPGEIFEYLGESTESKREKGGRRFEKNFERQRKGEAVYAFDVGGSAPEKKKGRIGGKDKARGRGTALGGEEKG